LAVEGQVARAIGQRKIRLRRVAEFTDTYNNYSPGAAKEDPVDDDPRVRDPVSGDDLVAWKFKALMTFFPTVGFLFFLVGALFEGVSAGEIVEWCLLGVGIGVGMGLLAMIPSAGES
jgi:hypothetical protein